MNGASPAFHRLDYLGLRESVVTSIREAIHSGALRPGDRLFEAGLADQMGISRAPIREALRQLELEGLVEMSPRRGAAVARFSREDVLEVYSLRSALEGLACHLAVERASADDWRHLRELAERMRQAAQQGDLRTLVNYDLTFHGTLCEISGHRRLLKTWRSLEGQARVFLTWIEQIYGDLVETAEGHVPILDALECGDGNKAEALTRRHIMGAGNALSDLVRLESAGLSGTPSARGKYVRS